MDVDLSQPSDSENETDIRIPRKEKFGSLNTSDDLE